MKSYSLFRFLYSRRSHIILNRAKYLFNNFENQNTTLEEEYQRTKQALRRHTPGSSRYNILINQLQHLEKIIEPLIPMTTVNTALVPHKVTIDVVSNGSVALPPCVIVKTPFKVYMFNVPEGATRYIKTLHIRESVVGDIFFTKAKWENFGGLSGFLLNKKPQFQDLSTNTRLHGPLKIISYAETLSKFCDDTTRYSGKNNLMEIPYTSEKYEDETFRVFYIPLCDTLKDENINDNDEKNIKSDESIDVAYLMELKPPVKRMNVKKIMELKIPKGPLLAKLKSGEMITLEDGRRIYPDDVLEENDLFEEKPTLLVVECVSIEKLNSLVSSSILHEFTNGSKQLYFVVHMTPEDILNTCEYKKWMKSFGENCTHLIVNGSGIKVPHTDGIYLHRYLQHTICPEIFPKLFPNYEEIISQASDMPMIEKNIFSSLPLSRLCMRKKKFENEIQEENCLIDIKGPKAIFDEALSRTVVEKELEEFRNFVKTLSPLTTQYPKITFLGTASAAPNKYRNVSSQILETNENCALMIDAGEGSYSQLRILYGDDKLPQFLTKLRAIFITHAHQDHTQGATTIITERYKAFIKLGIPYQPLIIVSAKLARNNLNLYSLNFQDIFKYVSLVDSSFLNRSNLIKQDTDQSESFNNAKQDSIDNAIALERRSFVELTQLFDRTLFSNDEWNLKSALSVQVIHSQINSSGFVFEDLNGRKVVFSGDTMPCELLIEHGNNADILVHECTFEDGLEHDAYNKKHSTMGQAVQVGKKMNAKYTLLTHFSSRYQKVPALPKYLDEAGNVGVCADLMVVPYGYLSLLPKLIPLYRAVYEDSLVQISNKLVRTRKAQEYDELQISKIQRQS